MKHDHQDQHDDLRARRRRAARRRAPARGRGRARAPATWPTTSAPTWMYQMPVAETTRSRSRVRAPPNRSEPLPSGSRGQPPQVLPVVGQQREVVRDDVGGGDRDQRVRERARELAARRRAGPRGHPAIAEPPRSARRSRTATAQPDARSRARAPGPMRSPRLSKKSCRSGARSLNSGPSLAPSNAVSRSPTSSSAAVPGDRRRAAPRRSPAARA